MPFMELEKAGGGAGWLWGREEEPSSDLQVMRCEGQVGQADGVQFNCLALPEFPSFMFLHPFVQAWQLSPPELALSPASCLALIILRGSS